MRWRWKAWKATYPKNQGTAIAESRIFLSDDYLVGQAKGHGNFLKRRVRMKGVAALHGTNVKGNPEMPRSCDEIQYSHCAKTQKTALMILHPHHQNHLYFTIWPSTCRTWKLVVKQQLTYKSPFPDKPTIGSHPESFGQSHSELNTGHLLQPSDGLLYWGFCGRLHLSMSLVSIVTSCCAGW